MKVDHILILAAGRGTRMGAIGRELPKVIWPIFEKTILELEVAYAKELYPEAKIYINLYHNREKTTDYINKNDSAFDGVKILIEEEELDVGGAIHNLANEVSYTGNVLILNSDQFLICKKEIIDTALQRLSDFSSVMFLYDVKKSEGYNEVVQLNNEFVKVESNKDISKEDIQTYTGMSLIDLNSLKPVRGKSRFFDSIIIPGNTKTYCQNIDELIYWDFGTTERYFYSMFKLLSMYKSSNEFVLFLKRNAAFDETKLIVEKGYGSTLGINLSGEELELDEHEICLDNQSIERKSGSYQISYKNLINSVQSHVLK